MSCVRPGVLLTNARRRRPASVLIALDLPALERPANAISGIPGGGSSRGSCAESEYAARATGSARLLARGPATTLEFPPLSLRSSFARGSRMRFPVGLAAFMALVYASLGAAAPADAPDLDRGRQLGA